MNKGQNYAGQALAGCGFVVFDAQVAAELRPDLWRDGFASRTDVNASNLRAIAVWPGLRQHSLRLQGIDRDLTLFARSSGELARRVERIVGRSVVSLDGDHHESAPSPVRAAVAPARERAPVDPFGHIATANPPVAELCGRCSSLTAAGSCSQADRTSVLGLAGMREPRRCTYFVPIFQVGGPYGRDLWPELVEAQQGSLLVGGK